MPTENVVPKEEFYQKVRDFIISWPLYRTFEFAGTFRTKVPRRWEDSAYLQLPMSLAMECDTCRHSQPWDLRKPNEGLVGLTMNPADALQAEVLFVCRACGRKSLYWLNIVCGETGGSLRKIGQEPGLLLNPPPLIAETMDQDDLALYRRALACRNSNFGIAAVAYLQRIVESRASFLIDLCATRLRVENPGSPLLEEVDTVKAEWQFCEKIGFAAMLLPKSALIDGKNPIRQLQHLGTESPRLLSDEESVDLFDACQAAFEHTIKRLKQDQDQDEAYKAAIRKVAERKSRKEALV